MQAKHKNANPVTQLLQYFGFVRPQTGAPHKRQNKPPVATRTAKPPQSSPRRKLGFGKKRPQKKQASKYQQTINSLLTNLNTLGKIAWQKSRPFIEPILHPLKAVRALRERFFTKRVNAHPIHTAHHESEHRNEKTPEPHRHPRRKARINVEKVKIFFEGLIETPFSAYASLIAVREDADPEGDTRKALKTKGLPRILAGLGIVADLAGLAGAGAQTLGYGSEAAIVAVSKLSRVAKQARKFRHMPRNASIWAINYVVTNIESAGNKLGLVIKPLEKIVKISTPWVELADKMGNPLVLVSGAASTGISIINKDFKAATQNTVSTVLGVTSNFTFTRFGAAAFSKITTMGKVLSKTKPVIGKIASTVTKVVVATEEGAELGEVTGAGTGSIIGTAIEPGLGTVVGAEEGGKVGQVVGAGIGALTSIAAVLGTEKLSENLGNSIYNKLHQYHHQGDQNASLSPAEQRGIKKRFKRLHQHPIARNDKDATAKTHLIQTLGQQKARTPLKTTPPLATVKKSQLLSKHDYNPLKEQVGEKYGRHDRLPKIQSAVQVKPPKVISSQQAETQKHKKNTAKAQSPLPLIQRHGSISLVTSI